MFATRVLLGSVLNPHTTTMDSQESKAQQLDQFFQEVEPLSGPRTTLSPSLSESSIDTSLAPTSTTHHPLSFSLDNASLPTVFSSSGSAAPNSSSSAAFDSPSSEYGPGASIGQVTGQAASAPLSSSEQPLKAPVSFDLKRGFHKSTADRAALSNSNEALGSRHLVFIPVCV